MRETMKCVYLVLDEGETLKKILREHHIEVLTGDGEFNEEYLRRCNGLIPGKQRVTKEILEKAPNLEIVGKYGVGVDRIDLDACTERKIFVANTPFANYISVAEHTMALMIAVSKHLVETSLYLKREYADYAGCRKRYHPMELNGKTLFLVGLGNIGRKVAEYASVFQMKIYAYDPYLNLECKPPYVTMTDSLEEGLKRADIVSLHAPGLESNRNLIDAKALGVMKRSAILINTSRGTLVDEGALYEALKEHRITGAGLDVFAKEPIVPGNPLMTLENVIASPHHAANSPEAHVRAEKDCADNILSCFAGLRPRYALNQW